MDAVSALWPVVEPFVDPAGSHDTLHGRAIVLVGFHGVGKTTFAQRCRSALVWADRAVIDLDPFHALAKSSGDGNVLSWEDYFTELRALLTQPVVLLLPCLIVLDWLVAHRVPSVLLLPRQASKQDWIAARVTDPDIGVPLRAMLDRDWDRLIDGYRSRQRGVLVELDSDVFLDDTVVGGALLSLVLAEKVGVSW